MAESTGGRTLVVFDFDWSLVDNNTDTWITILGGEKAASLQSQFGTDGFRHSCWTGTCVLSPHVVLLYPLFMTHVLLFSIKALIPNSCACY